MALICIRRFCGAGMEAEAQVGSGSAVPLRILAA